MKTLPLIAVSLAALVGCHSHTEPAQQADLVGEYNPPGTISIAPATIFLRTGELAQFSATLSAGSESPAAPHWNWSSTDPSLVSVDSTGLARSLRATPRTYVCATLQGAPYGRGCAALVVAPQ